MKRLFVAVTMATLLGSHGAWAHMGLGVPGGVASGFLHPLTGFDHVIAMVSVGLWAALLGGSAVWVLPITFPLVMAIGGVLGMLQVSVPPPELMIALSAVVLGLVVAFRARMPVWVAGGVVAVFAIFHGYAHGAELPEAADPLAYAIGFVVATSLLHAFGIGIGVLTRRPAGMMMVRAMGAAVAGVGAMFLQVALS